MATKTGRSSSTSDAGALRADALRNRQRLLAAARDVFVEHGADAPLDDVARRAGVGIATLYRRFPDRAALIRAVVLDVLGSVGDEARRALDEEQDAFRALARYMHAALDARISAVFSAVLGSIQLQDAEIREARDHATEPVQAIIDRAQAEGRLRADVSFADIGVLLVRLSRPLPGPFPPELDSSLAHRHLNVILDGLRANSTSPSELSGPAMSLQDLQTLAGGG